MLTVLTNNAHITCRLANLAIKKIGDRKKLEILVQNQSF